MNDDFLKAYRKEPRRRFTEDLRNRLRESETEKRRSPHYYPVRPILVATMFLVLLLASLLVLPGTRSLVAQSVNRIIAGIYVTEGSLAVAETSFGKLEYSRILRWSELDGVLPFKFRLPEDSPHGYELLDVVPVLLPSQETSHLPFKLWSAYAIWRGSDGTRRIVLRANYHEALNGGKTLVSIPSDAGLVRELWVDGRQVALLCDGSWSEGSATDFSDANCTGQLQLSWADKETGVVYSLQAQVGAETLDSLIAILETVWQ